MTSMIVALEERIVTRLNQAEEQIRANGEIDREFHAAIADIHTFCRQTEDDLRIMMNSCW